MKNTTLVIMAAGIGSRFGGGVKQLEPVGPGGEIIMDYSIYDALEAGFNKIVFIIRRDLEKDFKEIIGNRVARITDTAYAYQELDDLPEGFTRPRGRTKPWGTGQAILSCRGIVTDPFAVINADDYYGKEAFVKIHDYLVQHFVPANAEPRGRKFTFCMAGFILGNTLSENGGVTRGICSVDGHSRLVGVTETPDIVKTPDGAGVLQADGSILPIPADSRVSMNMWGFTPDILDELEAGFSAFLGSLEDGDVKKEYLLPTIVDQLIKSKKAEAALLETHDKWFGVTYKEDKENVVKSFEQLIQQGVYPSHLF